MNNAVYGMTSGQMAPTTLPDMVTTTSPFGRDPMQSGMPMRMAEMVATLPGAIYVTRQTVNSANAVRKTKKALLKAFQLQQQQKGTSFIEVLSNCPSNWKMTPVESMQFIGEEMVKTFPLGDIKLPATTD
jgi:2-oxoglutarate ferredoxin oxidoreductase subunit beta